MISRTINFSTGPVNLQKEAIRCFSENPLSHRSPEFRYLFDKTTDLFKEKFRAKNVYLLSGSGTLANEVMVQQIKTTHKKGLILSNGEFGNRLVNQARVSELNFITYREASGNSFDHEIIARTIAENDLHWILFCHCETSTGIINDLNFITGLCNKKHIKCYVDCISTVGAMDIDLSRVRMASASSGKGLCGVPGLAIVLSNAEIISGGTIPGYLDLHYYQKNTGIPFTMSSMLLKSLLAGSRLKLNTSSYQRTADYSREINAILKCNDLLPYENFHVFTIEPHRYHTRDLGEKLKEFGIVTSYQSEYLVKSNRLQLAIFGYYDNQEERWGINRLKLVLEEMITNRSKIKGHFFEMVFAAYMNKSRYNSSML
jgi:aspartate aminotransferase-like enzyme